MDLTPHVDLIRAQLAVVGGIGGPETAELVERLSDSITQAARQAVQNAVVSAVEEISQELAPGSAEVRLHGRDLSFVLDVPEPKRDDTTLASPPGAESGVLTSGSVPWAVTAGETTAESGTARISFRPPEALKARIEEAAERSGQSVNAYLVTTLTQVLATPPADHAATPPAPAGRTVTGWFQ